jgi:hypothetical protein
MNVIRTMRVESNVRRRSCEPQRPVDLYEPRRGGQGARGDLSPSRCQPGDLGYQRVGESRDVPCFFDEAGARPWRS